jgi:hypothetical protein
MQIDQKPDEEEQGNLEQEKKDFYQPTQDPIVPPPEVIE